MLTPMTLARALSTWLPVVAIGAGCGADDGVAPAVVAAVRSQVSYLRALSAGVVAADPVAVARIVADEADAPPWSTPLVGSGHCADRRCSFAGFGEDSPSAARVDGVASVIDGAVTADVYYERSAPLFVASSARATVQLTPTSLDGWFEGDHAQRVDIHVTSSFSRSHFRAVVLDEAGCPIAGSVDYEGSADQTHSDLTRTSYHLVFDGPCAP